MEKRSEVQEYVKECCYNLKGCILWMTFLPFGLGNSDVILGVQWLEKLGSIAKK